MDADGLSREAAASERTRFAQEDWDDLMAAETIIAFTEPSRSGPSRGGRHVELGAALASGHRVMVVGPVENVFCALPQVEHFETWDGALETLRFESKVSSIANSILALFDWLPKGTKTDDSLARLDEIVRGWRQGELRLMGIIEATEPQTEPDQCPPSTSTPSAAPITAS